MTEDLKIEKIRITRKGERNYFQVKLPRYAEVIIGIESDASFSKAVALSSVDKDYRLMIRRSRVLGQIQLQTNDTSNFFYSDELVQEDINDFFTPMSPTEAKTGHPLWNSKTFFAGRMKELDEVKIGDEKVIYGCYKDIVGEAEGKDIEYTVLIYVWYQYED